MTDVLDKIIDTCSSGMATLSEQTAQAAQVSALSILGVIAGIAGGAKSALKNNGPAGEE